MIRLDKIIECLNLSSDKKEELRREEMRRNVNYPPFELDFIRGMIGDDIFPLSSIINFNTFEIDLDKVREKLLKDFLEKSRKCTEEKNKEEDLDIESLHKKIEENQMKIKEKSMTVSWLLHGETFMNNDRYFIIRECNKLMKDIKLLEDDNKLLTEKIKEYKNNNSNEIDMMKFRMKILQEVDEVSSRIQSHTSDDLSKIIDGDEVIQNLYENITKNEMKINNRASKVNRLLRGNSFKNTDESSSLINECNELLREIKSLEEDNELLREKVEKHNNEKKDDIEKAPTHSEDFDGDELATINHKPEDGEFDGEELATIKQETPIRYIDGTKIDPVKFKSIIMDISKHIENTINSLEELKKITNQDVMIESILNTFISQTNILEKWYKTYDINK